MPEGKTSVQSQHSMVLSILMAHEWNLLVETAMYWFSSGGAGRPSMQPPETTWVG